MSDYIEAANDEAIVTALCKACFIAGFIAAKGDPLLQMRAWIIPKKPDKPKELLRPILHIFH
jgi:hypothetical protein